MSPPSMRSSRRTSSSKSSASFKSISVALSVLMSVPFQVPTDILDACDMFDRVLAFRLPTRLLALPGPATTLLLPPEEWCEE